MACELLYSEQVQPGLGAGRHDYAPLGFLNLFAVSLARIAFRDSIIVPVLRRVFHGGHHRLRRELWPRLYGGFLARRENFGVCPATSTTSIFIPESLRLN